MTVLLQQSEMKDETGISNANDDASTVVPYLGGEPIMFGEEKEREGIVEILNALTADEKAQMSDISMPIRHFRAEKVGNGRW